MKPIYGNGKLKTDEANLLKSLHEMLTKDNTWALNDDVKLRIKPTV